LSRRWTRSQSSRGRIGSCCPGWRSIASLPARVRRKFGPNRSLGRRNRANIRRQPIRLRRITEWNAGNCRTVMGIDRRSTAPCHSPRGSETMLLDQTEARHFEKRLDASRSRRSWFADTAAAPTSLRVSSGGAIAAAESVSLNGTGQRRGPRKPGSRSSGPTARLGIGLEEGSVSFLFHVSDPRPVQERQKSPVSSK
jgi:hypothetical protein